MYDQNSSTTSKRLGGFTLVELMIVVVIAAVLVSIAIPAYTSQIRKSRRTDARNAILDIAAREERFLSVSNSYSSVTTDVGYTGSWPQKVTNNYYTVSVTVPDPNNVGNGPSYIVTATAAGTQAGDTDCTTFTVNQIGKQSASTSAGVDNTSTCWGI